MAIPSAHKATIKKTYATKGKKSKLKRELQNLQTIVRYDKLEALTLVEGVLVDEILIMECSWFGLMEKRAWLKELFFELFFFKKLKGQPLARVLLNPFGVVLILDGPLLP